MHFSKKGLAAPATAVALALTLGGSALAASTVIVTPTHEQGWSRAATNAGGTVTFVADPEPGPPNGGNGALRLTTTLDPAAKAQYLHAANTPLSSVTELSYFTQQNSAPPPATAIADPAYQLIAFLNGGTAGFTTLVFEPYQNTAQGPIVPGTWQSWDVDAGFFWSTRTVTCSNGVVLGGAGGPAIHTLTSLKAACPNAVVAGFGVNIGSNNPGYNVDTDLFNFNGTTYNFELTNEPTSKDDCKKGGWETRTRADGTPFKNQGDCIQYVNTGK